MSYGDYDTSLEIEGLGNCLILGNVVGESDEFHRSNGAGKSAIPSAIQWGLFGRTSHKASPGDRIINWDSNNPCVVRINFKDGSFIERRRIRGKGEELFFNCDNKEYKYTGNTASTVSAQQEKLSLAFGIDWEVFCGSTFFSQYGKPWMEMSEVGRRKAFERLLQLDRFDFYAAAASDVWTSLSADIADRNKRITKLKNELNRLNDELRDLINRELEAKENKATKIAELKQLAADSLAAADAVAEIDVAALESKWKAWSDANLKVKMKANKVTGLESERNSLARDMAKAEGEKSAINNRIKAWKNRDGKLCVSCEQPVIAGHVSAKIDPLYDEISEIDARLLDIETRRDALVAMINDINDNVKRVSEKLELLKPNMSLNEALAINDKKKSLLNEHQRLLKQIKNAETDATPYDQLIVNLNNKIATMSDELSKVESTAEKLERNYRHSVYVKNAFTKRNLLRAYAAADYVKFFNSRLMYYAESFNIADPPLLNDSLQMHSTKWGYEFDSGGERKRIDVAIMLAAYDFHTQLFGRSSNLIVLDEVDGRLDEDGIESLVNVIDDEISKRAESAIIISHRTQMMSRFDRELKVIKENGRSRLLGVTE